MSSPSGGGKSTIARHLMGIFRNLSFSVSATTRDMRPGETHGKEYYFISKTEFQSKIKQCDLIEYEELFGNYYGSLKSATDEAIVNDKYLIFDVDVKGALSLQKLYPKEALLIFVAPPSMEVLEQRLRNRGTENEEQIQKRIARAEMEMSQKELFDYVIVNDILEDTLKEAEKIFTDHIS